MSKIAASAEQVIASCENFLADLGPVSSALNAMLLADLQGPRKDRNDAGE